MRSWIELAFLPSWCLVGWLSGSSSQCHGPGCLRFMLVLFPDHTHLIFVLFYFHFVISFMLVPAFSVISSQCYVFGLWSVIVTFPGHTYWFFQTRGNVQTHARIQKVMSEGSKSILTTF